MAAPQQTSATKLDVFLKTFKRKCGGYLLMKTKLQLEML